MDNYLCKNFRLQSNTWSQYICNEQTDKQTNKRMNGQQPCQ